MSPSKNRRQAKAKGPSPKKSISNDKDETTLEKNTISDDKDDTSLDNVSPQRKWYLKGPESSGYDHVPAVLERTRNLRKPITSSDSSGSDNSLPAILDKTPDLRKTFTPTPQSSSPSKRRNRSGAPPPSPKKAKSSSEESAGSSLAGHISELTVRSDTSALSMSIDKTIGIQDETPRAEPKIKSDTETDSLGMMSQTKQLMEVWNDITDEAQVEKQAEDYVLIEIAIANIRESIKQDNQAQDAYDAEIRADISKIQEKLELHRMKPDVSYAVMLDKQWALAMLQHRQRDLIRVGRDGCDEFYKAPFSQECYVNLAREIIHLARPEDVSLHGCHGFDKVTNVEMMSDFNLDCLKLVAGEPCLGDLRAFEAAAWDISRSLLVDREETFRCLAVHPYYQQMKNIQPSIKQELVFFFDRRFTYQIGRFYGFEIPVNSPKNEILLRLGSDSALRDEDGLDCGGADETTIHAENTKIWTEIIVPIIRRTSQEDTEEPELTFGMSPVSEANQEDMTSEVPARATTRTTTRSEISEYTMVTKRAFGADALELEQTGETNQAYRDSEAETTETDVPTDSEITDASALTELSAS